MTDNIIFLPFYYTKEGLFLVTIQTYGMSLRYFSDENSPLLKIYWGLFQKKPLMKDCGEVVLKENFCWKLRYSIAQAQDDTLISADGSPLQKNVLGSLDNIFKTDMPGELRLALLQVVTNELSEPDLV